MEASMSEEPGAVVPHAGICEGTVRVTGGSTSIVQLRSATELFFGLAQASESGSRESLHQHYVEAGKEGMRQASF